MDELKITEDLEESRRIEDARRLELIRAWDAVVRSDQELVRAELRACGLLL